MNKLRRHVSIDRGAGLTGAVLALLGALHVAERLGISGDDLAVIVGAIGTIAAELRHRKERAKTAPDTSRLNELNNSLRGDVSGAQDAQEKDGPDRNAQGAP